MATNAKNLAELLNTDTTVAVGDIADGSVTTAKLAADAVTAAKLADNAVVTANLSAGTLEGSGVNLGRRNLIINGDMRIAQRATGAVATGGVSVYKTIDRLKLWEDTDGAYTTEQSTVAPDGFSNSVKFQVTTADTSLAAAQYSIFSQNIEAQNLQHLAYGTNSAKTITVSFYVRSNKTGTYALCLEKQDNTTYRYIKEFSISSADTWERKEITIVPDSNIKAAAGAIDNDNGNGFRVFIMLAMGSDYYSGTTNDAWNTGSNAYSTSNVVNWMDNTSNNFYFTGFQVEVGSVATDFEHRSFTEELALCSRYYRSYGRFMMGYREGYSTASITLHPGMRRVGSDATNIVGTVGSSGVMYSRAAVNNSTGTLTGTIGYSTSCNDQSLQISFSHNGASTGSTYNGTVGALYCDGVTFDAEL